MERKFVLKGMLLFLAKVVVTIIMVIAFYKLPTIIADKLANLKENKGDNESWKR